MKKVFGFILCLLAGSAHAGVILGPTAVDVSATDTSIYGSNNNSLIDQSGLSANYISGVTDFAAFTSTSTAHYDTTLTNLGLGGVAELGSFYFDLGSLFNVDGVATWGQDCCSATLLSYDLYASDAFGAAGTRELIGRFSAGTTPNAYAHTFSAVTTRFLEIDVIANSGYPYATRLNEVVFGGSVTGVPEAPALLLMLMALAGFGGLRLRKNS
ncbi:MAG: hypothetical protein OEZ39_02750 [Gammaproteobacteria bacterium]|nr:hypothetical protein [Gammaproteobacteria bacterium]MDH5650775.1 hypothetical protein [Gammaproteobacteria bacterium]